MHHGTLFSLDLIQYTRVWTIGGLEVEASTFVLEQQTAGYYVQTLQLTPASFAAFARLKGPHVIDAVLHEPIPGSVR